MGKLDLDKLKVKSFITSLDDKNNNTIKGGYETADCDSAAIPYECATEGCGGGGTGGTGGGGAGDSDDAHCQSLLHACHTEKLDPHCN